MNKAYEAMRGFWLDVNNLQHKKEVPMLGGKEICVAGVEMAARDTKGGIKNLIIAASSLGNASVYFENNGPSGLGGFTGGSSSGPVRDKALRLMQAAAQAADKLTAVERLEPQQDPQSVTLFAVSGQGQIYAASLKETDARNPQGAFYAFFAYTQQLLGAFRSEQEKCACAPQDAQKQKPAPPAASADVKKEDASA